jgi:alpha-galactosidase
MGHFVAIICMGLAASAPAPDAMREILHTLSASGFDIASTADTTAKPFEITGATQDFGQLTADRACHSGTPLHIGDQTFKKGLGAHANGRISMELLEPCTRFSALVGIDNNADTQKGRSSVRFTVEIDGKPRFTSPVCRRGDAPVDVVVDLTGATCLDLVIDDAGDGISYDQADWAMASIRTASGKTFFIGDAFLPSERLFDDLPTSFTYDGVHSSTLLQDWARTASPPTPVSGGTQYGCTWAAPDGFEARLDATVFATPAAVEFRWTFANTGTAPSKLVTKAYAIDLRSASEPNRCILHSSMGGTTGKLDAAPGKAGFELKRTPLGNATLTVAEGRSSNGNLPFFCLEKLQGAWGVAAALGWSGQWTAHGTYQAASKTVSFQAAMDPVHFRLPPGESVRMPSALLIPFTGPHQTGTNALRRILRSHYQGKLAGNPVPPPVSFSSWFIFHNDVNAKMLTELAGEAAPLGIEYFCLDAGWFDGAFPYGVGNWTVDAAKFPQGLKAVADRVHDLGMKFGLWFEPERVSEKTRWHTEHGDLLFKARTAGDRRLLDLGKPEARQLIVDTISRYVTELGVDWIRYDFNVAPRGFWEATDAEDEQGLAQLRYINGLYEVLAELMARHPALLIEQCASGGRRIDLEMVRYGHTFWKSDDTRSIPLMRYHETGGNVFLPSGLLNTNLCEFLAEGDVLSLFAGPLGFGMDFRTLSSEQKGFIKKAIAAYKDVRTHLDGDYYPLFEPSRSQHRWKGWIFVDPTTRQGFLIAFRPQKSPYASATLPLPAAMGEGAFSFEDVMTGESLSGDADGVLVELGPGEGSVWRFAPK